MSVKPTYPDACTWRQHFFAVCVLRPRLASFSQIVTPGVIVLVDATTDWVYGTSYQVLQFVIGLYPKRIPGKTHLGFIQVYTFEDNEQVTVPFLYAPLHIDLLVFLKG